VLDKLASHYGLDVTKLKVVNLQPPEQLTALTNNEIQAFICWNPWPYLAPQKTPAKILHTGTVSYFADDYGKRVQTSYTRSVFVMSEDFIRKNPNAARAIMKVLLRAQAYVADPVNRKEVVQMISEYLNQPVEQNNALWDDYSFNPAFDQSYVEDMKVYTDYLVKTGAIKDPQDPLTYTYTGYVAEFRPGAVTVEGKWKP
jgi:ABC-type nitrate/sulfonate/bicarbonate transport system substrate-binding protein